MIWVVAFGLAWGSFLNVVIYRIPLGMSLLQPPSTCPSCDTRIKPYENIPILSYLFLRGRCRHCGEPIGLTYLLVEILTPILLAILHLHLGLGLPFFAAALFTSGLIVLGFIDGHHKILPDLITYPGIVLSLVYSFFRDDLTFVGALIGAAAGGGFLLSIYGIYWLVRKKEGLGFGDVTMMFMVGAFLGWPRTILTLMLASIVGAVIGIIYVRTHGKDLKFAMPFGSFLAPAAYVALVWGDRIIAAYIARFQN